MTGRRASLQVPEQPSTPRSPIPAPSPISASLGRQSPSQTSTNQTASTSLLEGTVAASVSDLAAPTDPPATPARPPFQPFFTLIADSSSSETHHPRQVHYIFSDDDASELLSSAYTTALTTAFPKPSSSQSSSIRSPDGSRVEKTSGTHDSRINAAPRAVLVDIDASGTRVLSAHALTPAWQVTDTTLATAPTWEAAGAGAGDDVSAETDGGMMLRIEGVDVQGMASGTGDVAVGRVLGVEEGGIVEADVEALMREFDARMAVLKGVVGRGRALRDFGRDGEVGESTGAEHMLDDAVRGHVDSGLKDEATPTAG